MTDSELSRVSEFSRTAQTEELLDRVTAFRADHDPAAIRLFESELRKRGISREEIVRRDEETRGTVLTRRDGTAIRCFFCDKPATETVWAWHRLWGKVPLFPRSMAVCADHLPGRD